MARAGKGRVVLVGAGPGDPGLLTLRGREALRRADVVVYDRLAGPWVLRFAKRGARLVPAESLRVHVAGDADGILRLLVREARRGRVVVRLKGGDPFLFGRGQEELEALAAAGVRATVVPGVTSAIAGPASAGIPVTHRDRASVLTIATGHEAAGKRSVPWERLARVGGTLVVLMSSDRIGELSRRLRRGGLSAATPAAVVSRASWPDQDVRRGTLGTIGAIVRRSPVRTPALLVVGDVVPLGDGLAPASHAREDAA